MYYIVNQNHNIIAADSSLLTLLCVENIDELFNKIALGEIAFSSTSEDEIVISIENRQSTYLIHHYPLTSLLGKMTLVQMQLPDEQKKEEEKFSNELLSTETSIGDNTTLDSTTETTITPKNIEKENQISLADDLISTEVFDHSLEISQDDTHEEISLLDVNKEPISFDTVIEDHHVENQEKVIEITSDTEKESDMFDKEPISTKNIDVTIPLIKETTNEDTISLLDDTPTSPIKTQESEKIAKIEESDELFDLTLPDAADETISEIFIETPTEKDIKIPINKVTKNSTPIVVDIENISQEIGISTDDYNNFLNEYIDTALTLEKDLQNGEKRSRAIGTLSHLASVLHLPMVSKIITEIKEQTVETQEESVSSFYDTLSRLTTTKINLPEEVSIVSLEQEQELESFKVEETIKVSGSQGFGTITLDNIKPIHFDFQLEEAANDLSLPVELIEEFVHDFIAQAHTETEKMLTAYKEGNLDAIQKIGHLLKGASSNLRINALSDTLYKIQFCEESSNLEKYIKDYWGHFLSFEQQINLISK